MKDFSKEYLICGFITVPEFYYEYIHVPMTKKEKRRLFLYKIKNMAIEGLCFLLLMIGITLQITGIAFLAGIFFKIGTSL